MERNIKKSKPNNGENLGNNAQIWVAEYKNIPCIGFVKPNDSSQKENGQKGKQENRKRVGKASSHLPHACIVSCFSCIGPQLQAVLNIQLVFECTSHIITPPSLRPR